MLSFRSVLVLVVLVLVVIDSAHCGVPFHAARSHPGRRRHHVVSGRLVVAVAFAAPRISAPVVVLPGQSVVVSHPPPQVL